jgi:hypothetical protein
MAHRTQFRHNSHQTRILALNSNFLFHGHFFASVLEYLIDFVVDWGARGETEACAD